MRLQCWVPVNKEAGAVKAASRQLGQFTRASFYYILFTLWIKSGSAVFSMRGWNVPATLTGDCVPPQHGWGIISY